MASSTPFASSGTLYIRTDVGGAYRWNKANSTWIPITDTLSFENRNDYGIQSIVVNPYNGNEVYIACGTNPYNGGNDVGTIYKSTNGGANWTQSSFTSAPQTRFDGTGGMSMNANGDRRWNGERLAADPNWSNNLLFGSPYNGLWKTSDDAATWHQVSGIPAGTSGYGVMAVAYDLNTSGLVYAAVEGVGVYKSTDHGDNWSQVTAIPSWVTVRRMCVSGDGKVWMTYGVGTPSSTSPTTYYGGIAVYTPSSNSCSYLNPAGAQYYDALAVDPYDSTNVFVSSSQSSTSEQAPSNLWHSTNEGASWTQIADTHSSPVTWMPASGNWTMSALLFDHNGNFGPAGSLWYVDGMGASRSNGAITGSAATFYAQEYGHEEKCVATLCTPTGSGPELLVGVLDQIGFAFNANNLTTYPSNRMQVSGGPWGALTQAIACSSTQPWNVVRIYADSDFGGPYRFATSTNGGTGWTYGGGFPSTVNIGGTNYSFSPSTLAIAPNNNNNVVVLGTSSNGLLIALYTTNAFSGSPTWNVSGGYFQTSSGTPCFDVLAVDASGVFYAGNAGYIYASSNGGASFTRRANPTNGNPGNQTLRSRPGASNDLWYSVDNDKPTWQSNARGSWEGLYHSTDGGASWSKVPAVTRCLAFSFGAQIGGNWGLYYYGRNSGFGSTSNVDTVYQSTNYGGTWNNILDPNGSQKLGNQTWFVQASMQTPGRVFLGTSGRGVFYSSGSDAPIGHRIGLKSSISGYFASSDQGMSTYLRAAFATTPSTWEYFDVRDAGNGNIALLCEQTGKYVTVDMNQTSSVLRADVATTIGTWEPLNWQSQGNGVIALYSPIAGHYVSCNMNDSNDLLEAQWANTVGSWEQFTWTDLGLH